MSAVSALILLLAALAASACASVPPDETLILKTAETVIGRARIGARVVLLTDVPALVSIDLSAAVTTRVRLADVPAPASTLWGLGESGGGLFSVSAFFDLLRVSEDGRVESAGRFERAIGNLFDLEEGMAGQQAAGLAGEPLALRIRPPAVVTPLSSPPRPSLGLSGGDDAIAQLLACSVPPRVVCWLPVDGVLFEESGAGLGRITSLEDLHPVSPASVIANPLERVIDDVVRGEDGEFYVLHRGAGEDRAARELSVYSPQGRRIRGLTLPEPVRLLLAVMPSRIVAVGASGHLVRVPR